MKFTIIINKWANFYFFLHNLAECEWPWPYRHWLNKAWMKELGTFTKEEKQALRKFKKIYKNHFLKLYLGKSFFLEKNPWTILKTQISQQEMEDIKNIFSVWQKKFEKLYKKDLSKLENWKRELNTKLKKSNKSSQIKTISKILKILYNCPSPKNDINIKVYLMLSKKSMSKKYAGGAGGERGRGLDGKSILLELSRCSIQNIDYVLGILWHEIIHSSFSPHYLFHLLSRTLKKKKLIFFIEEIINRSLFPIGVLSMRLFNAPHPKTLARGFIADISSKQTIRIINLSSQYIKQSQKFDKYYIKELLKILNRK